MTNSRMKMTSLSHLLLLLLVLAYGVVKGETEEIVYPDFPDWFENLENETGPPEWFQRLPGYECSQEARWPGDQTFPFECPIMQASATRPTSVHRLRPADINVIGALGDSLSSANGAGACFLPEVLYMYRGQCFSTGGDGSFETNPTIANILRKFNPDLKGYSLETNWWTSPQAGMNVGIPGAVADDLPRQARALINAMKDDPNIDFENDWKLITLFIGGNDLCGWCRNKEKRSAEMYTYWINEAIKILHDGLPRTYVAVIGILLIPEVDIMDKPLCRFMHNQYCSCALDRSIRNDFWNITRDYQETLQTAIESRMWDDKDDFTASLLPCLHESHMPLLEDGSPDYSYFAPDCFHFSHKAHSGFGAILWNNMMERVGERSEDFLEVENLKCPSDTFPFLYTNVNSDPGFQVELPSGSPAGIRPAINLTLFALAAICLFLNL
ncbi:phospholipase B1, membrane-associated-like [Apostichopus japonicus]|uniref:phospholipase B1, membrane-associated-like n=1 Tax=Stichopus japonicus TaxID=307972 RepID=UPI003AB2608C